MSGAQDDLASTSREGHVQEAETVGSGTGHCPTIMTRASVHFNSWNQASRTHVVRKSANPLRIQLTIYLLLRCKLMQCLQHIVILGGQARSPVHPFFRFRSLLVNTIGQRLHKYDHAIPYHV
jgi:hypothetical protein